jgi:hypothetical protein
LRSYAKISGYHESVLALSQDFLFGVLPQITQIGAKDGGMLLDMSMGFAGCEILLLVAMEFLEINIFFS